MRYEPNQKGACPHCSTTVRFESIRVRNIDNPFYEMDWHGIQLIDARLHVSWSRCPSCDRPIVAATHEGATWLVWPRVGARKTPLDAVPATLRADYAEACLVLTLSPKSSAALSRRCLQGLLSDQGYTQDKLAEQLKAAHDSLPSYVQADVDHVRKLGNLAAHPTKNRSTNEILEVEPGEAEWMLELLEALFDHFFVKPEEAKKRRQQLESKFNSAKATTVGSTAKQ